MTKIAGMVFRCKDERVTTDFYNKLGLGMKESQHGSSPLHFEVTTAAEKVLFEFYDSSTRRPKDTIMLVVDSVEDALNVAKDFGIEPKTPLVTAKGYRYIYITDPDDRDVMLIQEEP